MRKKARLFGTYVLIAILTIVSAEFVFWSRGYEFIDSQSEEHSMEQANLLHDIYVEGLFTTQEDNQKFVKNYGDKYNIRITIIDSRGDVLADSRSNATDMENHADREEVARALKGESFTTRRNSNTLGMKYSYTAVPIETDEFNGVLRVAVPLTALTDLNAELAKQVILSLCICFVFVLAVSAWLSTKEEKDGQKGEEAPVITTPQLLPFPDRNYKRHMEDIIQIDNIVVNRTTRLVTIDGKPVTLSKKEFELLCLLVENAGRVFSREVLLEKIWGYDYYGETRTVDVHIRNLRKKIEKDSEHPKYILTVRGYGYKFG